jgi:hypothetical protein
MFIDANIMNGLIPTYHEKNPASVGRMTKSGLAGSFLEFEMESGSKEFLLCKVI